MNIRSTTAAWIALGVLSILTWIADSYLWRWGTIDHFVLAILAGLCLLLAIRIVILSRARLGAAALCLVSLVVGQWWLTRTLLSFAAWSTGEGFGS
jgi:hypothetical protein